MTDHSLAPFNATALDGANADYIDQLAAKHAADPSGLGQTVPKTIKG
jgi:hypothetical protein